ncbi:choline transporter [Enemella evansiae]|uniref:Choline transporter n=1 Tax=Enemella evansiae TaxID=2016499 RepID=A0A255GPM1_9ACTN|nr:choline transporter [Enemella evansiae]
MDGRNFNHPRKESVSSTQHEIEQSAPETGSKRPLWPVFGPAAGIIALVVIAAVIGGGGFSDALKTINTAVTASIGWYYVLIVTGFVLFAVVVAASPLGRIRLGADDDEPEYGTLSWISMLFAAGMGIGLVFWGAAEPLNHLANPRPDVAEAGAPAIAQRAMTQTLLHWGVHAWAIYAVVGLGVAYAVHRRRRPISIRWALEPLLGKRIVQGPVGHAIDVAAIVGTLFGVASSLGLGVTQMSAGLQSLGILPDNEMVQLVLVVAITAIATFSVLSGLDKGIKWLSNFNMVLAALLVLAVLALGPTLFVLREFVQSIGSYAQQFVGLSFSTLPYYGASGEEWLGSWTTYYWGWWMAWAPFVGVFIARISKGRTVREFVVGVLVVPTLLTTAWFSIIGGTALYQQVTNGGLITDGSVSTNEALFSVLDRLPGGALLGGVAVLLVLVFFVTSSDSGSFVVDMISHGGNQHPPVWSRVFWATMEGLIAAVLLWAGYRAGSVSGGLNSLQTMAIIAAAPFSVVMILICISLWKALSRDVRRVRAVESRIFRREVTLEVAEALESESPAGSHAARNGKPDQQSPRPAPPGGSLR